MARAIEIGVKVLCSFDRYGWKKGCSVCMCMYHFALVSFFLFMSVYSGKIFIYRQWCNCNVPQKMYFAKVLLFPFSFKLSLSFQIFSLLFFRLFFDRVRVCISFLLVFLFISGASVCIHGRHAKLNLGNSANNTNEIFPNEWQIHFNSLLELYTTAYIHTKHIQNMYASAHTTSSATHTLRNTNTHTLTNTQKHTHSHSRTHA